MRELADNHYSRRTKGAQEFTPPGRILVLRDVPGKVLFAWQWPYDGMRMDGQTGYNCLIFRNESTRRSSDIILEAEAAAFAKWGPNRLYTYVDAKSVKSVNPGYCFKCAGWVRIGRSKSRGYDLLAKER